MPSDKKRINLTLDDYLLKKLIAYRDEYDHSRWRWSRRPTPLATIIVYIIRDYLKECNSSCSNQVTPPSAPE